MSIDRTAEEATAFFDRYRDALLARDAEAIAALYHHSALIAFAGNVLAVSDAEQTRSFAASSMEQYEGAGELSASVDDPAATPDSIWAEVTWDNHGAVPDERFVHQLLKSSGEWLIGVLTPVDLQTSARRGVSGARSRLRP